MSAWLAMLLPAWALAAMLYAICVGVLYPMRWVFEGRAYNVAFSSNFGDAFLIAIIALAAWLLQSGRVVLPSWVDGKTFHMIAAAVSLGAGVFLILVPNPLWRSQVTDNYHNLIVVPLLLYLLVTSAPVYWFYSQWTVWVAVGLCIASWALLVAGDFASGRIDQRAWLQAHGVRFPK